MAQYGPSKQDFDDVRADLQKIEDQRKDDLELLADQDVLRLVDQEVRNARGGYDGAVNALQAGVDRLIEAMNGYFGVGADLTQKNPKREGVEREMEGIKMWRSNPAFKAASENLERAIRLTKSRTQDYALRTQRLRLELARGNLSKTIVETYPKDVLGKLLVQTGAFLMTGGAVSTAVGQALPGGTAGIDYYLVFIAAVGLSLTAIGFGFVYGRQRARDSLFRKHLESVIVVEPPRSYTEENA